MLWLLRALWIYRTEIEVTIRLLARLRKTAREVTREYIRKKIQSKLKQSLLVVSAQISLFVFAYYLNRRFPSWEAQAFSSILLWAISLFNFFQLLFVTIPEIRSLRRTLRGKIGYALKYVLEISLVTELMRWNVIFLTACLIFGISSRTFLGTYFSYTRPWKSWGAARFHQPTHRAIPR